MLPSAYRPPLLINIDGLDATGKTEHAEALTGILGATYVECVPSQFTAFRCHISDMRAVDARYLFFMSALAYIGVQIRELLDGGTNVVVQSYLMRTRLFHRAMGATAKVALGQGFPLPDVNFILETDESERQRRLNARNEAPDSWVQLATARSDAIVRGYRRTPAHRLNTTRGGVAVTVHELLDHSLNANCGCNPHPPALPWRNLRQACLRAVA